MKRPSYLVYVFSMLTGFTACQVDAPVDEVSSNAVAESTQVLLEDELRSNVGDAAPRVSLLSGRADSSGAALLTRVADVRVLSAGQAGMGYPVRLRGVVTYYDPDWNMLLFQDETGGILADMEGQDRFDLEPGDLVQVEGSTQVGDFAPVIVPEEIRHVGDGELPDVLNDEVHDHVLSGQADSWWVELRGVVRCMHRLGDSHLMFDIVEGGHRVSIYMPTAGEIENPERLIDAHVKVYGVVGTVVNNRRQLIEATLFSPGFEYVQIDALPAQDPFSLPVKHISQLLRYAPGEPVDHRVRIQGEVLAYQPGEEVWVRDASGGIQVRTPDDLPLEIGDVVDIVGFAESGRFAPILQDGTIRRLRAGSPPTAIAVTAGEAMKGDYGGQLVKIDATLIEQTLSASRLQLTLKAGEHVFHAVLNDTSAEELSTTLRVGSLLRVHGINEIDGFDRTHGPAHPSSFVLLMRTSKDIVVIEQASWWTFENLSRAFAVLAGVVLLMIGWVIALRRRVRQQTRIIADKLEEEERLKEEAQAASEAKSRFLSAVSHELRTPLTSILGYTDILEEEVLDRLQSDEQEYLRTVRDSGERLLQLVNDLLDVSAAEAGHLHIEAEPVSAMSCVYEVVKQLYPLAEAKGLELSAQGPADTWVRADEARLRQVLLNLTSNAIKFTGEGGVTIEVVESSLHDGAGTPRSAVAFVVRDTGRGIAPDFLPRLFEYFSQEKSKRGGDTPGTGLGLAISRELIQRMGGTISVQSKQGAGSEFTFILPADLPPDLRRVRDLTATGAGP